MNKYRKCKVELVAPSEHVDKFDEMLRQELAPRAKLEKVDKNKKTVFSFFPTESELFLIRLKLNIWENELKAESEAP